MTADSRRRRISVCVFCGSHRGRRRAYASTATAIGREIAKRRWTTVYGGADRGLMGLLANAALEAGGEVAGVIPSSLVEREVAHTGVTRLEVVDSMHERKARMAELSDFFVALPGGLGTLEELFEIWTWRQLGFHDKPVGLLDVCGYYRSLENWLDRAVDDGFLSAERRATCLVDDSAPRLLERLATMAAE